MVPTRTSAGRGRARVRGRGGTSKISASDDDGTKGDRKERRVRFATPELTATARVSSSNPTGSRIKAVNGPGASDFPGASFNPQQPVRNGVSSFPAKKSATTKPAATINGKADVQSFQQRYQLLKVSRENERSAAIAAGVLADPDKPRTLAEAITPKGTCPDMCPEFERVERVVQNDVWAAEVDPESEANLQGSMRQVPDEARMVKKFRRAAAGLDEQLPSDLRPPSVLQKTVDYLFNDVIGQASSLASVHHFVWDRTRAIRNDFSIQQISKSADLRIAIDCYERIARFHILSLHQLALPQKPYEKYDSQQEREQLDKTLLSLVTFYDDSRGKVESPHEAEFRAYCVIFQMQDPIPDLEDRVQAWPPHVVKNPRVQGALRLYAAASNTTDMQGPLRPRASHPIAQAHWRKFWAIVESNEISYLMACVAEIYFNLVRRTALESIWRSYRRPNTKNVDWSLDELLGVFGYDDEEQVEDFVEQYGFSVAEGVDGAMCLELDSVSGRQLPEPEGSSKQIRSEFVENKRHGRTLSAVISGLSVRAAKEAGLIEKSVSPDGDQMDQDMQEEAELFVPETKPTEFAASPLLNPLAPPFQTEPQIPKFSSEPTTIARPEPPNTSPHPFTPSDTTSTVPSKTTDFKSSPFKFSPTASPAQQPPNLPLTQPEPRKAPMFEFSSPIFNVPSNSITSTSPFTLSPTPAVSSAPQQAAPSPVFNFGSATITKPFPETLSTSQLPISTTTTQSLLSSTISKKNSPLFEKTNHPLPGTPPKSSSISQFSPLPVPFKPSPLPATFTPEDPSLALNQSSSIPSIAPKISFAAPAAPTFVPPLQSPKPKSRAPASPIGPTPQEIAETNAKKAEVLDRVAEAMMLEPYGILDHFIEFIAGPIILAAQRQVESEKLRQRADEFRIHTLTRRYGERWRQLCWNRRLLRQGRERRRRFARDAELRAKQSSEASITSQLEAFRESVSSWSSQESAEEGSRAEILGSTIQQSEVNATSLLPTLRPQKSPEIAPITDSQSMRSPMDASLEAASKRRRQAFHRRSHHNTGQTALEKYSLNVKKSSLSPTSSYQVPYRPLNSATRRTDTTRSSYFKLKAMGIDPSGTSQQSPLSNTHIDLKRHRSIDSGLAAVPEAKRVQTVQSATAAHGQRHRQTNGETPAADHTFNKEDDDDEAILTAARETREAMAETISFFREEAAKEGQREKDAQQREKYVTVPSSRPSVREPVDEPIYGDRVSRFLARDQYADKVLAQSHLVGIATGSPRGTRPFTESLLRRSFASRTPVHMSSNPAAAPSASQDEREASDSADEEAEIDSTYEEEQDDDDMNDSDGNGDEDILGNGIGILRGDTAWGSKAGTSIEDAIEL